MQDDITENMFAVLQPAGELKNQGYTETCVCLEPATLDMLHSKIQQEYYPGANLEGPRPYHIQVYQPILEGCTRSSCVNDTTKCVVEGCASSTRSVDGMHLSRRC